MLLRELQIQLLHDLLYEGRTADTEIDTNLYTGTEHYIQAKPGRSAAAQVGVYRDSIIAGMINALAEIYPVCEKLVGSLFFSEMCVRYIKRHPSRSADLDDYGVQFPGFIRDDPAAASLVYLPDVARLEWAWHRAFIAPGTGTAEKNLSIFATLDEAAQLQAGLCLPKPSFLLASAYPVHRIWQINQQEDEDEDDTVSLDEGGIRLIIWRNDLEMRMDVIDSDAAWFLLQQLQKKLSLLALCESFANIFSAQDIGALLEHCMANGWIDHFEPAGQADGCE